MKRAIRVPTGNAVFVRNPRNHRIGIFSYCRSSRFITYKLFTGGAARMRLL